MTPRIIAELAANHGLITRKRALELGLSDGEVADLVRRGAWRRLRRGVYVLAEVDIAAVSFADRRRLTDRAACLAIRREFVRSHTTAMLELGVPILLPSRPMAHVTRNCLATQHKYGVKHHLAPYRPGDVVGINGFAVLGHVRSAIDIAREYGHPYGVVAIDRVRWLGHSEAELAEVIETQMKFWPDRRDALRALEQSCPGSESVAETLGRDLVEELGVTGIETQFGLTDGRRTHFADLRLGRHLIEIDGRQKYVKDNGPTLGDIDDVILAEKQREDWFRGFHLGMSRLTWSDVWGPGRQAAKERLRRELAQTDRLWGTAIDDLERFRVRRRAA
ncbi:hypothetical protein GCM10009798_03300 [Nocardioides panacihumi]|uniref:AbiEi antitoxin N-terminal domain-containing protein n=2 Tax=Nocardioides panacihumi TaxID=400774 RepID=A0ABN2Q9B8_9ACTN